MTAIGFALAIVGVITLFLFNNSMVERIAATVMVMGILFFLIGITIKLWEVMP